MRFVQYITAAGLSGALGLLPVPSVEAWTHFVVFGVVQAAFQLFLPGRVVHGPTTPKGNVPEYKVSPSRTIYACCADFQ